jgi:hypothetical protein
MTRVPPRLMGLICLCFFPALAIAQDVPRWKVDPSWPKPLPHNWTLGHLERIIVDKDGNIWTAGYTGSMDRRADHVLMGLNQTPPIAECCIPAPEVIEFDPEGNVLRAWGGRGWVPQWPEALHGFWVDRNMNVWVAGNHAPDRNLLKFTADGKLLMEIGRIDGPIGAYSSNRGQFATPNNQATDLLGGPGGMFVDEEANEVYVADGYVNKRIVVFDSNTGKFKRGWGAYGIPLSQIDNNKIGLNVFKPGNPSRENFDPKAPVGKQFSGTMEFVRISNDGLVYVSDRDDHRLQVFTKDGRFVQELILVRDGGVSFKPGMFAFSRDPDQKFLIVADGDNHVIRILNRKNGSYVGKFGSRGRNAGQFDPELMGVDLDSNGNLYTAETKFECRAQKFVLEK